MMNQKWEKKGQLFAAKEPLWWSKKYGILPTPFYLPEENLIRIYYGTTDEKNNGRITFLDVDAEDPSVIVNKHLNPVLDLGSPGCFDDCGVVPSSIIKRENRLYLYYVGFQRCEKVPYMLFPGLAFSNDMISFKRHSPCPIIDRIPEAPFSNAAPFVLFHDGKFKMWHWLGKEWVTFSGKLYLQATIGYSESDDGIKWKLIKSNCIVAESSKKEFSVGRPWVVIEDGKYKMWYSVRHEDILYRIYFAESTDGLNWNKIGMPEGLDVSENGWDSEMMCYPAVLSTQTKTFLFYNGNNNGETGFGYAELVNQ